MQRLSALFVTLCLAACGPSNLRDFAQTLPLQNKTSDKPMRIVSLDFCADQYVMKMVEPERILAVSPDAGAAFSYMRDKAAGLNTVRSSAEDVLILKPDLVVRSYGGGPNAARFLQKAGIRVLNIGWAGDIDGIKRVTTEMAQGLGVPERGAQIVADIDKRLAALKPQTQDNQVLYMTPSGTTSGSGSLVHEMIEHAGFENFQTQPGWRSLPLERLAYEQPDMIAAGFFDTNRLEKDRWSAMRHPIARAQINGQPTVMLNGSWMSCGAWFSLDAIEAMSNRNYKAGTP